MHDIREGVGPIATQFLLVVFSGVCSKGELFWYIKPTMYLDITYV
jgi:hypothetical protein